MPDYHFEFFILVVVIVVGGDLSAIAILSPVDSIVVPYGDISDVGVVGNEFQIVHDIAEIHFLPPEPDKIDRSFVRDLVYDLLQLLIVHRFDEGKKSAAVKSYERTFVVDD